MSYGWNLFQIGFFHLVMYIEGSSMSFHGLVALLFFSAEYCSIARMYHSLFIYLLTEGHLGCSQILVIMNKATVAVHRHIFVWI